MPPLCRPVDLSSPWATGADVSGSLAAQEKGTAPTETAGQAGWDELAEARADHSFLARRQGPFPSKGTPGPLTDSPAPARQGLPVQWMQGMAPARHDALPVRLAIPDVLRDGGKFREVRDATAPYSLPVFRRRKYNHHAARHLT